MMSEFGNFLFAMTLGFAAVQVLASFWGSIIRNYLSPCGRGRNIAPGEGYSSNQYLVISNQKSCGHIFSGCWLLMTSFCQPLTRPFRATSPTRGEVDEIPLTKLKFLTLGRISAYLQACFLGTAMLTLMIAFLLCDFSIATVAFHDHTNLPWYYRLAATWGNHEGSLLLFVLILSGFGATFAALLHPSLFKARALCIQGILTVLFLLLLMITSNPFQPLSFTLPEGNSLNPLLQDQGLWSHPPLLYLGYVGFSAPFSLAIAALWGKEDVTTWGNIVRPWVLFAWASLTAGITLGSWWAYYELGWGGWWFWDPVESASFMPWLAGTALLHTLRTNTLYRWSLFLSILTFGLSLLGTFLVRSHLITSVHSFAQDPEIGVFVLSLMGGIMGVAFLLWIWRTPYLQSPPLIIFSRNGTLLFNSLSLTVGLCTVLLGTLYPLWSEYIGGGTVAIGTPYFERTFIPLMVPLLILIPIGSFLRNEKESLFPLLLTPLIATLGTCLLLLYTLNPISLWSFTGFSLAVWIIGGTLMAFQKNHLPLGASLAHIGVAVSLLGMSAGTEFRSDETRLLKPGEILEIGGFTLTLQKVEQGKGPTYFYERATLTYPGGGVLTPEKRLYQPQNSLLSETAISTNGLRDLYVILGSYQGNNRWLIRASFIPLAPWIWIGGALMTLGALVSLLRRKKCVIPILFLLFLPTASFADSTLEKRAHALNQEVRCPICLGQSIADSSIEESEELKLFIQERLREGDSEDVIREKLRTIYGNKILFRPPFEEHTYFLWFAPFGLFLLIVLGFLWKIYLSRHPPSRDESLSVLKEPHV